MKINDTKLQSVPVAPAKAAKDAERVMSERIATTSPTNLTSASTVSGKNTTSESFDAKKVEEIKLAIANGSFKVDSAKVADGILNSVREILGKK